MTVRTISQLPGITQKADLTNGCLFETSKPTATTPVKYTSKKVSYETLNSKVQEDSKKFLQTTYGLRQGMNINNIEKKIDDIYNSDVTLSGQVAFKKNPVLVYGTTTKMLATRNYVDLKISNNVPCAFGPVNTKVYEIPDNALIFDTSKSYTRSNVLTIPANITGNLVMWGWLADNGGTIHPSKAWVALKQLSSPSDVSDGVILQVSPWIFGKFSSSIQYVSFNIPIVTGNSGITIRIDTGFEVNEQNSGNQDTDSSLADSVPNKFVGYVLKSEEII